MDLLPDTSLKHFHTFGVDVYADAVVAVESSNEILALWRDSAYSSKPKMLVGEGSNLLFCENYRGVVVLNRLKGIEVTEDSDYWYLHVGSGENWHHLVEWSVTNGMPGLENLALIPGCAGSAPIQNIGAYGVELKDRCHYVDTLDLESGDQTRLTAKDCQFGYRDSVFKRALKNNVAIVAVGFKLAKAWKPVTVYGALAALSENGKAVSARDIFDEVCAIRRAKLPDPSEFGNAGSFFKNPVVSDDVAAQLIKHYPAMAHYPAGDGTTKLAAGWLIEHAGLKGKSIGGAKVHDKQALVLINTGLATASDLVSLAKLVVETVKDKFGIALEHEVRFIGSRGETTLEALCLQ